MIKNNIEIADKLLRGEQLDNKEIRDPLLLRLHQALQGLYEGTASIQDTVALVRQILRFNDSVRKAQDTLLPIYKEASSLSRKDWESYGIKVTGGYVSANPWTPSWLEEGKYIPAAAAFACEERRKTKSVPADPYITKQIGYSHYHNTSQRDAIRALLSMPEGATLTVNIPTGSGKSLVAWLPALLGQGLTVVIVPITSLALDQEEAMLKKHKLSWSLAYHGGNDPASVNKRKEIRDRINNNQQRILFTSPESLNTSLYDVLLASAYRGELTHFVVDEAHMIYEWGNDFRSAFQKIAGARRAFMKKNKDLKTVLLSATFTTAALDLLASLFSEPGPFKLFSSVQLRPEPSYWFKKCIGQEEKGILLKEAIYHLPRPLILYTSLVEDATQLYNDIKAWGFKRVGILTGRTKTNDRSDIVQKWKNHELDIVVGTSAFGLGIDQANVRAVIHACIPESLDRYYQEVGRGGRDGCASMSLVLYTDQDLEDARGLSTDKILTADNGWKRWEKMFETKTVLPDGRYRLDLGVKPRLEVSQGDKNEGWNLKALLLMTQAKLLVLDEEKMPRPIPTDDKQIDEANWQHYVVEDNRHQVVEILDSAHLNEDHWKAKIEGVRKGIIKESKRGYEAMHEVLNATTCVGNIFQSYYKSGEIKVVSACGGCSYCRTMQKNVSAGFYPKTKFMWENNVLSFKGDLGVELKNTRRLIIFHQEKDRSGDRWERKWQGLVNWMVSKGIQVIISDVVDPIRKCRAVQENPTFLFTPEETMYVPPLAKMRLCFHSQHVSKLYRKANNNDINATPEVYFIPYESRDPTDSKHSLREMVTAPDRYVLFDEFLNKYRIA